MAEVYPARLVIEVSVEEAHKLAHLLDEVDAGDYYDEWLQAFKDKIRTALRDDS